MTHTQTIPDQWDRKAEVYLWFGGQFTIDEVAGDEIRQMRAWETDGGERPPSSNRLMLGKAYLDSRLKLWQEGILGGKILKGELAEYFRKEAKPVAWYVWPLIQTMPESTRDHLQPQRFDVYWANPIGSHLIALVHYRDGVIFRGFNLLVYLDTASIDLSMTKWLDPEFRESGALRPFARFEPTQQGFEAATMMVSELVGCQRNDELLSSVPPRSEVNHG